MKKVIQNLLLLSFLFVNQIQAQTIADGIKFMENENFTEAQKIFEAVAKREPSNPLPHYQLGQLKYALEDYKASEEAYNTGLKVSSKCTECSIGLAKLMLDNGKTLEVDKILEGIAKSNKKNAYILALIGDAYLFSKKPNGAKAVDYLSRSRDIDPKSASTYAHMGDAYQLVGDMGRAMSSYESAVEKDKTNLEAYMSMARIWKTSRQTDLAIEKVESAIKLNDNYAPAYKELVQLYIDKKQYDKVVAPLEKYTSLAGSDVKAKVRLVKFLCYQAKDYERAISEGEKLVISNPEEYTLHRWLAWSYGEIEKWQESYDHSAKLLAALDQDKSRQSFPTDIEYYAKAALKIKKFEEAAMLYEKLMVVDTSRSKNTDFYGVIAKAYLDNKEFGKAVEYFKKRETYSPLNGTEQANLATAYYRLKQYSEAETSFKKVVEASPTYTYGYYMIAKCKDNMELDPANKTGLAKEAFIKFVEVASTDKEKNKKNLIEAYDYLGRLAINTEPIDKVNATSYYEMILELDPNDQDAIKILEILKK